jgi:hypothetical protein
MARVVHRLNTNNLIRLNYNRDKSYHEFICRVVYCTRNSIKLRAICRIRTGPQHQNVAKFTTREKSPPRPPEFTAHIPSGYFIQSLLFHEIYAFATFLRNMHPPLDLAW